MNRKAVFFRFCILVMGVNALSGCDLFSDPDPNEYVARGQESSKNGEWSAALIAYKNAVAADPDNGQALVLLAEAHIKVEDGASAAKELRKAQALDAPPAKIGPLLAQALLLTGDNQAVVALEQDVGLDRKDQAKLLALQGIANLNLGHRNKATDLFDEAQQLDAGSIDARIGSARLKMGAGELNEAREILNEAVGIDKTAYQAWSLLGDLDRLEGNLTEAEAAYSKAIDLQVIGKRDIVSRIFLKISRTSYDEAATDIAFLRSKYETLPILDFAEGLMYFQQQNYAKALPAFEATLGVSPDYLPAIFYLGTTQFMQQQDEQALHYLEKYDAKIPGDVKVTRMIAAIKLRSGNYEEAEQLIRPVVAQYPDDTVALKLLAGALMRNSDSMEGIDYLERITELQPGSASARMGLGMGLLIRGETVGGMRELEKARELDPEIKIELGTVVLLHLQNKAHTEAVEAAQTLVEQQPEIADAHFLLGTALMANGQAVKAKMAFEQAISQDPGHINSLNALANMAIQEKSFEDAIILHHTILGHHPGNLSTLRRLAVLEGSLGNEEAMLEALSTAIDANPGALPPRLSLARYYSMKNQPDDVIMVLEDTRNAHSNNPTLLALLGESELALRQYDNAIRDLGHLCKLAPANVWANYLLAQAYAGARDGKAFKATLKKVLVLDESHYAARLNLARYYLKEGELEKAESTVEVLETLPESKEAALILRGDIANSREDSDSAISFYEQAFALAPSNLNLLRMEEVHWQAGDRVKAMDLLTQWIGEHPDDQLALSRVAARHTSQGKNADAISAYEKVIESNPNNVLALNNLAWMLKDTNTSKAIEYAERANSIMPESDAVLDTLAVLYSQRDTNKAQKFIQRALDKRPDNPDYNYHKAMILDLQGDSVQARKLLKRLLSTGEEFGEKEAAKALLAKLTVSG